MKLYLILGQIVFQIAALVQFFLVITAPTGKSTGEPLIIALLCMAVGGIFAIRVEISEQE